MTLSPQQQSAVERSGQDVCVVAGPGSGKTRVLVERFHWLVDRQQVSPLRILAITFTEKAAHEIKARLVKQFADKPQLRQQIERAYVSTLHAFCMRLLRENAIAAGLDPRFEILDERDAAAALHECAAQTLDELFQQHPRAFRGLLSAWKTIDPAADLIHVYEAIRVSGGSPGSLPAAPAEGNAVEWLIASVRRMLSSSPRGTTDAQRRRLQLLDNWLRAAPELRTLPVGIDHFRILNEFKCDKRGLKEGHPIYDAVDEIRDVLLPAARAELIGLHYGPHRQTLVDTVQRFHRMYSERKRSTSVLDFSDLEEHAIALLRRDTQLRETVRLSFEAVLMDELQDTNPLQWELMDLVRREDRFFAVGDINQSIFGFRHAEPHVFRAYRDRIEASGATVDQLSRNHRSREAILRAVDAVTGGLDGIEPNPLEAGREFAETTESCVEVIAAVAGDNEDAALLEARWVARRIREIEGTLQVADKDSKSTRPARFSDIAVLVRNSSAVDNLEQAFREFSVPFLMNRGRAFFEELEITDLVAWLRVLANPRDEIALSTVLRSPFFGISDEALLRLKPDPRGSLADGIRNFDAATAAAWQPEDVERLQRFRSLLRDLRALREDVSPDRLLARAIDECGYEDGLLPRERANLDKFLHLLRTWHARRPRPLPELIDSLEDLRAAQAEPSAPANDTPDAVQVLTIHAAKGLEFPVVFVAAMHLGVRSDKPALLYSAETGLGVLWRDPENGDSISDPAHEECWKRTQEREAEEADRLLYVAMTRAEELLVLSYAERNRHGGRWPQRVAEALPSLIRRVDTPPASDFAPPAAGVVRDPDPLPAPRLEAQFDSTASVTALAQFQSCPRQYYLQRYLGWQPDSAPGGGLRFDPEETVAEDTSGELTPTELGTAVHSILAGLPGDSYPAGAHELAERFRRSELGARAARAGHAEREFDFVFTLEQIVLRGQIDLWFEEGGELVLVDYKTDRYDPSRVEHYAIQLRLYALAIEKVAGRLPDQAWLYFLRPNEPVPVDLSPASLASAREMVARFREAQNTLSFPLHEGKHCFHCGFYHGLCPR